MMFLTGRQVDEPDAKEPSRDEQKKEKEGLDRAKKEKVPPPPPKFSARAKLVEVALAARRSRVLRQGDRQSHLAPALRPGTGDAAGPDALGEPAQPSRSCSPGWPATRPTHGYDLRRLIRGLVLSEAYARSSRWEGEEPPRPSLFAVALVRPLTPMQLASSLRLATADPASLPADLPARPIREADRGPGGRCPLARRVVHELERRRPDRRGRGAASSATASGSPASCWPTAPDRLVGRLKQTAAPAELIDLAVRNVLSRPPDDDEVAHPRRVPRRSAPTGPRTHAEQLVWALLTCSEFRFNH